MDLLITITALLVAIYAVVPRERQLDLRLRINAVDRVLVVIGSLTVLYLEFNDYFSDRGWVFRRPWPAGITPRHAMYLVMVGVTLVLWVRIQFSRLTRGKISEFRELVEQLYWSESYSELLTLLQKHLRELFRIYNSRFLLVQLRARLQSSLGHGFDPRILRELQEAMGRARGSTVLQKRTPVLQRFRAFGLTMMRPPALVAVKVLPDNVKASGVARDIIRGILISPRFVGPLVSTRPYFGLEIIREAANSHERFDFVDVYLTELMRDTESALYAELRNNQNCGISRYQIPDSNRLLFFFMSDIKVAYDNRIYKPVGDFTIAHLHEMSRDHDSDPYNLAMTDFEDVGAWRSPLFVAIRFFDIMVKEALFQGIQWHMWLYYMPDFVEGIVRNYRMVDPNANPTSEWPIRYTFLLYEVFSSMRDWVMGMKEVPRGQANAVLGSTRADHENGNIPKSSILALSQCSRHLLESGHVPDRVKGNLMDIVFRLYFELREVPELEGYATVLGRALSAGGFYRPSSDAKYHDALMRAFEENETEYLIKHTKQHVEELEAYLS